jgi:hypothetical protein
LVLGRITWPGDAGVMVVVAGVLVGDR